MEESVFVYCKVDFAICLRFTRSFFFDLIFIGNRICRGNLLRLTHRLS